jgi:hypothetical protein
MIFSHQLFFIVVNFNGENAWCHEGSYEYNWNDSFRQTAKSDPRETSSESEHAVLIRKKLKVKSTRHLLLA